MRHDLLGAIAAATLISACAGEPAPEANQANQANNALEPSAQQQLEAMPEGQRNAVFIRAIRDAGLDCQHVDRSEAAAPYRGRPVWTAICAGGGRWTLVLADGGTVQILNANEAALAGAGTGNEQ